MSLYKLVFIFIILALIASVSGFSLMSNFQDTLNETYKSFSNADFLETARNKKKNGKQTLSLILGALIVKAIIFPLAFKVMAVMSSIAVLLSTMSLIVSSIVGYTKLAWKHSQPSLKVVHINDGIWAKDDDLTKGYGYIPDTVHYDSSVPSLT